jgi:hypothetical protein
LFTSPSQALERLVLRLPFLETSVTINLGDVQSTSELIRLKPDLADLQMAGDTRLLELIDKLFLTPLPVETKALLQGSNRPASVGTSFVGRNSTGGAGGDSSSSQWSNVDGCSGCG